MVGSRASSALALPLGKWQRVGVFLLWLLSGFMADRGQKDASVSGRRFEKTQGQPSGSGEERFDSSSPASHENSPSGANRWA